MDRRGFLKLLSGAAAVAGAAPLIPFNRVWSFPSKIVIPKYYAVINGVGFPRFEVGDILTIDQLPGLFAVSRVFPGEKVDFVRISI